MNKNKSAGMRFVESLLLIGAADIAAILVKFVLQLVTVSVRQELTARGASGALAVVNAVLAALCLASFLVLLAVLIALNPVYKGDYLNRTFGQDYRFGADLREIVRSRSLTDLGAAALLGLPLYTVLFIVGDINYLPTLFTPFYAMWELTGNAIVSWIAMSLLIPVWLILVTVFSHHSWDKHRLRTK